MNKLNNTQSSDKNNISQTNNVIDNNINILLNKKNDDNIQIDILNIEDINLINLENVLHTELIKIITDFSNIMDVKPNIVELIDKLGIGNGVSAVLTMDDLTTLDKLADFLCANNNTINDACVYLDNIANNSLPIETLNKLNKVLSEIKNNQNPQNITTIINQLFATDFKSLNDILVTISNNNVNPQLSEFVLLIVFTNVLKELNVTLFNIQSLKPYEKQEFHIFLNMVDSITNKISMIPLGVAGPHELYDILANDESHITQTKHFSDDLASFIKFLNANNINWQSGHALDKQQLSILCQEKVANLNAIIDRIRQNKQLKKLKTLPNFPINGNGEIIFTTTDSVLSQMHNICAEIINL